ncbi:D-hexose-6-phosphate mutarotase [Pasteurellaceae bacterium RH1A]|nr:D-hexose-6-phosphate mutarotase [Pasteurellaceae bacterium RH1A]
MQAQFIRQVAEGISLEQFNQIPVVVVKHRFFEAQVALQGAQLIKWQPAGQADVLWLSEIEPFELGTAIRGGIPICYPWFGGVKSPAHGFARIQLWEFEGYRVNEHGVLLTFLLQKEGENGPLAKVTFQFSENNCEVFFRHLGSEPAQAALHTYFNVADIEQTLVHGLPNPCFNSLTQQEEDVPSPRAIAENVDCIYKTLSDDVEQAIEDKGNQRQILINHQEASEVVLWNPWHKPTSQMSQVGYKTMVCVETARISSLMEAEEELYLGISLKA